MNGLEEGAGGATRQVGHCCHVPYSPHQRGAAAHVRRRRKRYEVRTHNAQRATSTHAHAPHTTHHTPHTTRARVPGARRATRQVGLHCCHVPCFPHQRGAAAHVRRRRKRYEVRTHNAQRATSTHAHAPHTTHHTPHARACRERGARAGGAREIGKWCQPRCAYSTGTCARGRGGARVRRAANRGRTPSQHTAAV